MSDYVKNYINGAVSGSVAAFVSHPFFRLKVAMQNEETITLKTNSNVKWLYNGVNRAMVGYGIEKMLIFGTYNSLTKHNVNPTVAGFISGIVASLSITPAEQLIIDKGLNVKCLSLKHLYSGLLPTLGRESLGFAVHFTVYDYVSSKYNKEREILKTIVCGTCAVIVGWGTVVPLDRIKTQVQTGKFDIKTYDIRKSYSGFGFALMRAIPFHVTCFVMMEMLNKL